MFQFSSEQNDGLEPSSQLFVQNVVISMLSHNILH